MTRTFKLTVILVTLIRVIITITTARNNEWDWIQMSNKEWKWILMNEQEILNNKEQHWIEKETNIEYYGIEMNDNE